MVCHTTRQKTSATRNSHVDFALALLEGVLILVGIAIGAQPLGSVVPVFTVFQKNQSEV